jgi:hypothetical protein
VPSRTSAGRLPRVGALALGSLLALLAFGALLATATAGGTGLGNSHGGVRAAPTFGALGIELSATPGAGYAPLTVEFRANVTGEGPGVLSIQWTFGDGSNTSGGLTESHVYRGSGRFVATVSIRDNVGDSGNASIPVYTVALPTTSSGLTTEESLGVIVSGVGLGVLAAFATFRVLGRRPPPASSGSIEEVPPPDAPPPDPPSPGVEVPYKTPPSAQVPSSPWSPAPAPAPAESPLVARRRASDEILLHLGQLGRPHPDEVADPTRTQGGMSEHLGMPQNVVSPILRRLEAAGVVAVELRHVRDARRRLKVYRLTDRGEAVVRALRSRR